ncbi:hypothetical protein HY572_05310 [Candidatus Micrarchaeota archaeon]|nr:hypothetical protein [Candidatus Micrarchaeota archaeon]
MYIAFLDEYLWAFLLLPIGIGLAFPGVLLPFFPYAGPMLIFVMILSLLPCPLLESLRHGLEKENLAAVAANYGLFTALCLAAAWFFPPELFIGFVVVGAAPASVSANAMVDLYHGNVGRTFSMTTVSYALSPLVMPGLILLLGSANSVIDVTALFHAVALYILIPFVVVMALRHTPVPEAISPYRRALSLVLLLLLIGAQVAQNADYFYDHAATALALVAAFLVISLILFFVGLHLGRNRKDRISFAEDVHMKNGTIALTVLTTVFNPVAGVVAVAQLIAMQAMFGFAAKYFSRKGALEVR